MKQRTPQTIDQIIHSFKGYGLGDIEHNKDRAISGFILSVCFIDQLASFRYFDEGDLAERWDRFIDEYMPMYSGKKLYTIFRNSLFHHYSSCGRFGISYGEDFKKEIDVINGVTVVNSYLFIQNLQKAFVQLESDIRTNKNGAGNNAIQRSIKHPVLINKNI